MTEAIQTDAEKAAAALVNKPATDPANKVAKSGAKVTVCCKMPNGMILQLWKMQSFNDPVMGGGTRQVQRAVEMGAPIKVFGPARAVGADPHCLVVGGYALTPNVDKEFWQEWLKQNKDHDAVKNRIIFAQERQDAAQGMATDLVDVTSGLQPIVPDKDKRLPRGNRNMTGIKTADEQKAVPAA